MTASTTTVNGTISGLGGILEKTGAGELLLTAANSYSGGTDLNAGSIFLTGNGTLGTGPVNLAATTTLNISGIFSPSYTINNLNGVAGSTINIGGKNLIANELINATYAGDITGTGGSLTKEGVGTLALTGTNNYTGGTNIEQGGLSISSANNIGTGGINFAPGLTGSTSSILYFNGSFTLPTPNAITIASGFTADMQVASGDTVTIPTSITGGGTLNKTEAGTLILTSANSYSGGTNILGGSLDLSGSGSLNSTGPVTMASNTTFDISGITPATSLTIGDLSGGSSSTQVVLGAKNLTLGTSHSTSFGGQFIGTGSLTKMGSGTFSVTGSSPSFTGNTNVSQGTLNLSGLLGGSVIVNSGASLTGPGFIEGNLTIHSGANLAPGNSTSILHANGNYIQDSNSTYQVQIDNKGHSTLVEVGGTVTLNGGQVIVTTPTGQFNINSPYAILDASAGLTGAFAGVTPVGFAGNPVLYKPELIYTSNVVFFEVLATFNNAATNFNQMQIANQLDSIINPSAQEVLILDTIAGLSTAEASLALDQLSGQQYTTDFLVTELANRQFIRRLYDPLRPIITHIPCSPEPVDTSTCCFLIGVPDCDPDVGIHLDVWGEVSGGSTILKGNRDIYGLNDDSFELTVGVQSTFLEDWTVGVAGSFEWDTINYKLGGTANNYIAFAGLYGLYRPFDYYVLADLAYGYGNNRMKRTIQIGPSLSYIANSKPRNSQATVYAEAGMDFKWFPFLVQPFLGFEANSYWEPNFIEDGAGDIDLAVTRKDRAGAISRLGVHMTAADFYSFVISVDLAWQCRIVTHDNDIKEHFTGFGTEFTIQGMPQNRNGFDGALSISKMIKDNCQAFVEFSTEMWGESSAYIGTAGVIFHW